MHAHANEKKVVDAMRIGFCQFNVVYKDIETNMKTIETMLKDVNADIVVLPELALTGYYFKEKEVLAGLSEESRMAPMIERLRSIASKEDVAIVIGLGEVQGDALYNTAYLIDHTGVIGKHSIFLCFPMTPVWSIR